MASSSRRGRRAVALVALAGGAIGVAVALRALDVHDLAEALDHLSFRIGRDHGLWALGLAVLGLAAAALAPRRLAWSAVLAGLAGIGGFLAVGALWLLPGALLLAASFAGLALVEDPVSAAAREEGAASGKA